MSIPNEALPSVSHNRQFPHLAHRVQVQPTGVRADSDAGGEVRRDAYARPDLYRRVAPPPAHEYRELND